MLIQNLQITLRNIFRNKLTTLINIFGLSISLACCVLIILFIRYELSYDRFSINAHRIYRFTFSIKRSNGYQAHFARCAEPWVKFFPEDFPEIQKMVTLSPYKNITLKINDEKFSLKNSFYTDSTFFNVFNIKILHGDPARVLKDPNTAVISSSLAAKYFKNTDPVGQTITNTGQYEGNKWISRSLTITGVFKDIPANSHFHSDLFLSKASIKPNDDYVWKYVYLMMKTKANPDDFIKKFPDFLKKHGLEEKDIHDVIPDLQCITDIHLKSDKDREIEQNGNLSIIYIIGLIGIVILVISWINYLNLTIARVFSHGKSIILYKIYGNIRSIFTQYFIEALLINLISLILAIILIGIFFPIIRTITGNVFNDNALQFIPKIIIWLSVLFAGSLLIGCIPVAIKVIKIKSSGSLLKPALARTNKTSSVFRKSLVVFQFTLTIILITCALVINIQSKYIIDHQAGAKQDSVLVIKLFNQDILSRYDLLKAELLKSPYIKEASATFEEPYAQTMDAMGFETDGIKEENKDKVLWVYSADDNFFKFNNIPIIAGSDFPVYNGNLKKDYYILNETAVRDLGWTPEEAVGKPFKLKFPESDTIFYGGNIVGVAKDFNLNTLHHEIKPFIFFQKEIWFWVMLIKVDTEHRTQAMDFIKQKWEMISPDYPLTYEYNSDVFFAAYKKEIIQSRLTWFFSVIAIIISCLGLFAISSIVILRRTKEIGLRKVNGASIFEIMRMLSVEFTRGVLIAFLIAVPIAYYIMNKWLQNFVYKTELDWWIFILAGLIGLIVALLTVSWQCWCAARRNPVEALRYE
jgi:putative ABC transport system permease protein